MSVLTETPGPLPDPPKAMPISWFKVKALTQFLSKTPAVPTTDTPTVRPQHYHQHQRLKIFIGTWNMYGRLLPIDLEPFLTTRANAGDAEPTSLFLDNQVGHPYHLMVIGTQECERDISESLFYPSKEMWEQRLAEYLGPSYQPLRTETLAALHLAVFVWKPMASLVKQVHGESIKTGWANMIGNKGAVAISLQIGSKDLLFINCHLRAHQTNLSERNANVQRILSELHIHRGNRKKTTGVPHAPKWQQVFKKFRKSSTLPPLPPLPTSTSTGTLASAQSTADATVAKSLLDQFDHVFLFGDTNYRIDASRSFVLQCLQQRDIATLLKHDQLSIERQQGGPLAVFKEHPIYFMPTYKFDTSDTVATPTPTTATSPASSTLPSPKSSIATVPPQPPAKGVSLSSFILPSPTDLTLNTTITYDTSPKMRVPSWTDRILWHDRPRHATKKKKRMMPTEVPNKAALKKITSTPWLMKKKKKPTTTLQPQLVNRDTLCYHYDAVMDHRLIGASDHFPVIGIYGVWFDEWQTTPPALSEPPVKKSWPKKMGF
ncbi:DNase I-like protein [Hesseltinella vesiculosa]|uniref:DNase I-like protein n=1 Tax=Hesseltinella vesiculosa TaxID=101127 RepID=A0A1X2GHT2_9FUNG|nr:DNase I-like protein [Hesseltinella vesiculosa]